MKKPDRFDRIAGHNVEWNTPAGTPMISSYEAADLLRKEHAWIERAIKRLLDESVRSCDDADYMNGYQRGLSDLRLKLQQRRK